VEPQVVQWLKVTMEYFGRKIETVGPRDGACLGVDAHLSEEAGVVKIPDEVAVCLSHDVAHVPDDAIVKEKPHHMRLDHGDTNDARDVPACSHGSGSIVPGSSPRDVSAHEASGSERCSSIHRRTSRTCRIPSLPASTRPVAISKDALSPPWWAWTCGVPWSRMYR